MGKRGRKQKMEMASPEMAVKLNSRWRGGQELLLFRGLSLLAEAQDLPRLRRPVVKSCLSLQISGSCQSKETSGVAATIQELGNLTTITLTSHSPLRSWATEDYVITMRYHKTKVFSLPTKLVMFPVSMGGVEGGEGEGLLLAWFVHSLRHEIWLPVF